MMPGWRDVSGTVWYACYCRRPVRSCLLAFALLGACGRSEETAPSASSTATNASGPATEAPAPIRRDAASGGYCRHEVTGALTGRGENPASDLALTTDYFMTREEHRRAFLRFGLEPDEIGERMKHDPLLNLFTLHCEGFLDLFITAGDAMKYVDLPFGPGTYPIAARPNRVNARFSTPTGFGQISAEGGQFVLERFDGRGAAGTFAFDAKVPTGNIHVAGTFDLPCLHPTTVCGGSGTH